jgi:hypothetical protein
VGARGGWRPEQGQQRAGAGAGAGAAAGGGWSRGSSGRGRGQTLAAAGAGAGADGAGVLGTAWVREDEQGVVQASSGGGREDGGGELGEKIRCRGKKIKLTEDDMWGPYFTVANGVK